MVPTITEPSVQVVILCCVVVAIRVYLEASLDSQAIPMVSAGQHSNQTSMSDEMGPLLDTAICSRESACTISSSLCHTQNPDGTRHS